ncbi:hypothetical protein ABFX02_07G053300 [Erythranthe guttata]
MAEITSNIASGSNNPADNQSLEEKARVVNNKNTKQASRFSIFRTGSLMKKLINNHNLQKQKSMIKKQLDIEQQHEHHVAVQIQRPQRSMKHIPPTTSPLVEEDEFFGPEKEEITKKLLLPESGAPASGWAHVISVWGPWGLGKTRLLKKLYNDFEIRRQFQCFAWVYMPADFETRNIMQTIVVQLVPSMRKRVTKMSFLELAEELISLQLENKCLIVLSDVRDLKNWRMLSVAFPTADKTRTRILLTTREREFAERIGGDVLGISPLDDKQSWKLFERIIDISFNQHAKKTLKEIVTGRCKGSPLAIAILAGYLNNTDTSNSSNSEIDSLKSHLQDEQPDITHAVQKIVSISYAHLPDKLKECLLYLAHLPSEGELHLDDLYVRWIYEDTISKAEQNPMEVAEHYLEELALRNLVQMLEQEQDGPSIGTFLSCKLHPLVREFFTKIGDADKVNTKEFMSVTVPRLPLNSRAYQLIDHPNLRSLTFAGTFEPPPEILTSKQLLVDFTEFYLLRVLEFYGIDFRGWDLPRGIGQLIELRYLSFQRCYLEKLPSSIGELILLETLDLRVEPNCIMAIPNVLWKMTKLERLYFPARFQCADSNNNKKNNRLSLKNLGELQVLVNFDAQVCHVRHLQAMTKLEEMSAVVVESHIDLDAILDYTRSSLVRRLSLDVRNFNCYSENTRTVLAKLFGCEALVSLHLEGYIKKLPTDVALSYKLVEIVLSGSELESDPMPIFGQIANLRSLVLCKDAYVGTGMKCGRTSFGELRSLKLRSLRNLETWDVEEGAMPQLMILSIEKCARLEMLPAGLEYVARLRELKIVSMPPRFEERLQGEEGEDVRKVKQLPRIIICSSV